MRYNLLVILFFLGCSQGSERDVEQETKEELSIKFTQSLTDLDVPKNLDEALSNLHILISDKDKEKLAKLDKSYYSGQMHMSLGLSIRNFWIRSEESKLTDYFNKLGIFHPDDMSSIILSRFYAEIKNQPFDLNKKVEYYKLYWINNYPPQRTIYPPEIPDSIMVDDSYSFKDSLGNSHSVFYESMSPRDSTWIYQKQFGWKWVSRKELKNFGRKNMFEYLEKLYSK